MSSPGRGGPVPAEGAVDDREASPVPVDGPATRSGVVARSGTLPILKGEPLDHEPRGRLVVGRLEEQDSRALTPAQGHEAPAVQDRLLLEHDGRRYRDGHRRGPAGKDDRPSQVRGCLELGRAAASGRAIAHLACRLRDVQGHDRRGTDRRGVFPPVDVDEPPPRATQAMEVAIATQAREPRREALLFIFVSVVGVLGLFDVGEPAPLRPPWRAPHTDNLH